MASVRQGGKKGRSTAKSVRTQKKSSRRLAVKSRLGELDFTFLFLVFILLAFGLIMLLSSSTPVANRKIGDSYYFFTRQLAGAGIGAVLMVILAMVDYHKYIKFVPAMMLGCTVLLILCRVPGIGQYRSGGWRWLRSPFIQFQPSEFMKPIIALFFAKLVSEKRIRPELPVDLLKCTAVLGVIFLIMWKLQSHASGAIIICAIAMSVILVGGAKLRYFIGAGVFASPVAAFYIKQDPMRLGRILSFLDPFRDTSDKSFQITQSLIAIGTGGLFGKGLGQSVQKYSYLPEPYNDFIFAIVCEELGFLGAGVIIALFAALVMRGVKIALEAPDEFGMLAAIGIISHIAIQAVFNIAVVCCAMPTTGISLPFFSFGGTAILVVLAEVGIVINISRQSVRAKKLP